MQTVCVFVLLLVSAALAQPSPNVVNFILGVAAGLEVEIGTKLSPELDLPRKPCRMRKGLEHYRNRSCDWLC